MIEVETCVEFFYNNCLQCDYKDCKKRVERQDELESALQKIKNEKIRNIRKITGITF
ncbi:unnamed protein product [marine sediment metagenome]|uniref:Uncharacterized protein n=1 Tax=marine sediment metagenome TaxID=412755 RepID=X1KQ06_9ZZZZ